MGANAFTCLQWVRLPPHYYRCFFLSHAHSWCCCRRGSVSCKRTCRFFVVPAKAQQGLGLDNMCVDWGLEHHSRGVSTLTNLEKKELNNCAVFLGVRSNGDNIYKSSLSYMRSNCIVTTRRRTVNTSINSWILYEKCQTKGKFQRGMMFYEKCRSVPCYCIHHADYTHFNVLFFHSFISLLYSLKMHSRCLYSKQYNTMWVQTLSKMYLIFFHLNRSSLPTMCSTHCATSGGIREEKR